MSPLEIQIVSVTAVVLTAFAIHRIVAGPRVGDASASPLERAEKRLEAAKIVAQSLFAISVLMKFAIRLEWLDLSWKAALPAMAIPFLVSVAVYLKARLDVKRASVAKP
jgi:hypothetical protein